MLSRAGTKSRKARWCREWEQALTCAPKVVKRPSVWESRQLGRQSLGALGLHHHHIFTTAKINTDPRISFSLLVLQASHSAGYAPKSVSFIADVTLDLDDDRDAWLSGYGSSRAMTVDSETREVK